MIFLLKKRNRSVKTRKPEAKIFKGTAHLPYMRVSILQTLCTSQMMVKIGIPSNQYENRNKPGPRRVKGVFSHIFKSLTTALRQVLKKEMGCTVELVEN